MKYLILLICSFCFVLTSCVESESNTDLNEADETLDLVLENRIPVQEYSKNELIVRYVANTTSNSRAMVREINNVEEIQLCKHCDASVEKWIFEDGVDLENKMGEISEGSGDPESVIWQVEREFRFSGDYIPDMLNGGSGIQDYISKIKSENDGITIAVIDTGIDVNYPTFDGTPFLYNASHLGLGSLNSGWNYAYNDHNTYDDHTLVHGTAVASLLKDALDFMGVPFQLMPLKVANENGKVTKFNLICALLFASDKVDVMQISLGWYDVGEPDDLANDIFLSILKEIEQEVVVVTSAGNRDNNNDVELPHYPSDYMARNLIAVAALNPEGDNVASYSNFGPLSVDFVSHGTLLPFLNNSGNSVEISGTSFAAPFVAAIAAKYLYSNPTFTPSQVINEMNNTGTVFVDSLKPTFYGKKVYPY